MGQQCSKEEALTSVENELNLKTCKPCCQNSNVFLAVVRFEALLSFDTRPTAFL